MRPVSNIVYPMDQLGKYIPDLDKRINYWCDIKMPNEPCDKFYVTSNEDIRKNMIVAIALSGKKYEIGLLYG